MKIVVTAFFVFAFLHTSAQSLTIKDVYDSTYLIHHRPNQGFSLVYKVDNKRSIFRKKKYSSSIFKKLISTPCSNPAIQFILNLVATIG